MDVDWCLRCNRHTDGSAFCSVQCEQAAAIASASTSTSASTSSSALYHHHLRQHSQLHRLHGTTALPIEDIHFDADADEDEDVQPIQRRWSGKDEAGIRAWAREVPAGVHLPPLDPAPTSTTTSSTYPGSTSRSGSSSRPRRLPTLLRRPEQRSLAPSLCMSRPETVAVEPTLPIATPLPRLVVLHTPSPRTAQAGARSSLSSAASESLPTPGTSTKPSSPAVVYPKSVLGGIATRVRAALMPAATQRAAAAAQPTTDALLRLDSEKRGWSDDDHDDSDDSAIWIPASTSASAKPPVVLPRLTSRCALDDHPAFQNRGRRQRSAQHLPHLHS